MGNFLFTIYIKALNIILTHNFVFFLLFVFGALLDLLEGEGGVYKVVKLTNNIMMQVKALNYMTFISLDTNQEIIGY